MLKEQTIQLGTPLALNEITVAELVLKEPTMGQLLKVQQYSGMEQTTKLIAIVSGVQPLLIEQMAFSDFRKCVEFIDECFADSPPTS